MDARIFLFVHDLLSHGPLLYLMAGLSALGEGWTIVAFVPFLVRARTRGLTSALLGSILLSALAVFVLKRVVGRARPFVQLAGAGVKALVFEGPRDGSFPSGHSAASFAFAAFVAILLLRDGKLTRGRVLGSLGLFALAALIGVSRVALGVHFPGDVAAGALLGTIAGAWSARLYLRRRGAPTSAVSASETGIRRPSMPGSRRGT